MENETGFDLNRALDAWKADLAALPEVSGEDVRELETHVLECFETERRRGHSEPEAFALAVRQIGSPERLRAEFAKVNPLRSWPHRVALMAFAGLLIWAWSSVTQVVAALLLFWGLPLAKVAYPALFIILNCVLPLCCLALVAKGGAKSVLHSLALVFRNRLLLLISVTVFGVLLNLATVWSLWNSPNPETFFGPGGREKLSFGTLFWQYCSHLLSWPGPYVALLVWLAPCAQRTFSAAACSRHNSGIQMNREVVFWFALGYVVLSCFGVLANATVALVSRTAFWLYPPEMYRVLHAVLPWLPNVVLCALAIMAARGKMGFLAERLAVWRDSRSLIAAAGIMLICVSYGALALTFSGSPSTRVYWLLSSCFWPLTFLGVITWLAPSRTTVGRSSIG